MNRPEPVTTAVVAVARNSVIGNGPDIPWQIPGEQRRFKDLTMGGVLVMGRLTFESIGRPLPGRLTIVVTRDPNWHADGVRTASSVPAALAQAGGSGRAVFIAGGGQIYAEALPSTDAIELTEVHAEPEGDVRFPALDPADWREVSRVDHETHSYVRLERIRPALQEER